MQKRYALLLAATLGASPAFADDAPKCVNKDDAGCYLKELVLPGMAEPATAPKKQKPIQRMAHTEIITITKQGNGGSGHAGERHGPAASGSQSFGAGGQALRI